MSALFSKVGGRASWKRRSTQATRLRLLTLLVGARALHNQTSPTPDGCAPDVSHYQFTVDWSTLAARLSPPFAIAKATEGVSNVDDYFARNWRGMRAAGIAARGAYHFGHPQLDAATQVKHFVDTVGALEAGDFLILDIETASRRDGITAQPAEVAAFTKAFCDGLRAATALPKERVFVYTGSWFWNYAAGGSDIVADYPLWLSAYSATMPAPSRGWEKWTLWQFTDRARLPGISGPVDCSVGNLPFSAEAATTTRRSGATPHAAAQRRTL